MKISLYKCGFFSPIPPTHLTFCKNVFAVTQDCRFYAAQLLNIKGHMKSCWSNEDGAAKATTEKLAN